jgi:hypothetical protein
MLLGTATWSEGRVRRRALVAPLASGRLADLSRLEAMRLRKLGEGDPDRLAAALVPDSLAALLRGGPRALARARQALRYAEKWDGRGTLPEDLAPRLERVVLGPCLPEAAALRRLDGASSAGVVRGPGVELRSAPQPTLAALGLAGGGVAGFCLAFADDEGPLLGAWMTDRWPVEDLELRCQRARRGLLLRGWEGLELPPLGAAEVLVLPSPRLRALPTLPPGAEVRLLAGFDALTARLGPEALHETVQ